MKGKVVSVRCAFCKIKFDKSLKEFNRSEKVKKRHLCSRSCCGKLKNSENKPNTSGLNRGYNKTDEYSPFRFYMKTCNGRRDKLGSTNLDLKYLKGLWEEQDGICPLTGWKLVLPNTSDGWKGEEADMIRSSLDRIDSSKGYIRGNVRYISQMANYAKNRFDDSSLIEFCKAVVEHQS